jgi:hypothetical protein
MKCASPLDWDSLLAYWLGELDAGSAEHIEEHYLGCAVCSRRLEQLANLAREVRAVARSSGVNMVVTEPFVRRLSENGLRVREYRVPLDGAVNCTVTPEDDFVVARLEAPLDDVERLDMITVAGDGARETRQEDIPFVAASGGVVVSTRIDALRALPASTIRMRLLAVSTNGERALGEYTFNHTPGQAD